jgi:hypothetical protein
MRSSAVINNTEILNSRIKGFSLFVTTVANSIGLNFGTAIILQYGFDLNCNVQVAMGVGSNIRSAIRSMSNEIWSNWFYYNINT